MSKVRTGVLSDSYIKANNPQFFPLDLGSNFQTITLPTHDFKGIKQSLICKNIALKPIIDLHNYAQISTPQNSQEAEQKAIIQYKELIKSAISNDSGNKFMNENLETNFNRGQTTTLRGQIIYSSAQQTNPTTTGVMETQTSVYDTDSPTINLKSYNRKRGADKVSHELGSSSRDMFSVRTRATLANMVDKNDYQTLVDKIYPSGYNPKMKLNDQQVLEELMKIYPDEIELIQNTYDRTLTNTEQRLVVRENEGDDDDDEPESQNE